MSVHEPESHCIHGWRRRGSAFWLRLADRRDDQFEALLLQDRAYDFALQELTPTRPVPSRARQDLERASRSEVKRSPRRSSATTPVNGSIAMRLPRYSIVDGG